MTATVKSRTTASKLDRKKYSRLVAQVAPMVIDSEEEFRRTDAEIGRLLSKGFDNLSIEENSLLTLLTKLIEDYEERNFSIPDGQPHESLKFLIEQNDLRQTDLTHIFGSRGRVSEVINGKRAISKIQAKALGEFFKVSPALFI